MSANVIRVSRESPAVDARTWTSVSWITAKAESVAIILAASFVNVHPASSFPARADIAPVKPLLESFFDEVTRLIMIKAALYNYNITTIAITIAVVLKKIF